MTEKEEFTKAIDAEIASMMKETMRETEKVMVKVWHEMYREGECWRIIHTPASLNPLLMATPAEVWEKMNEEEE